MFRFRVGLQCVPARLEIGLECAVYTGIRKPINPRRNGFPYNSNGFSLVPPRCQPFLRPLFAVLTQILAPLPPTPHYKSHTKTLYLIKVVPKPVLHLQTTIRSVHKCHTHKSTCCCSMLLPKFTFDIIYTAN